MNNWLTCEMELLPMILSLMGNLILIYRFIIGYLWLRFVIIN